MRQEPPRPPSLGGESAPGKSAAKVRPRPPAKRPRLIDIAQQAGVSMATVSLALRDHPSIGEDTRNRIRAIQKRLGYRVTPRGGASGTPQNEFLYCTVGVDMRDVNYLPFLEGVAAAAKLRGASLRLEALPSDPSALHSLGAARASKNFGIIISGRITDAHLQILEAEGVPFVVVGNYRFQAPCHRVSISLEDVCRRAVEDLHPEGMRRIISMVEVKDRSIEREYLRHLDDAAQHVGIRPEDCHVIEFGPDFRDAAAAIDRALALRSEGSRIFTFEKHSTECVLFSAPMRAVPHAVPSEHVIAFSTSPPSLPRFAHCRVFDLGGEVCGRLAVDRLLDLFARPDTPPSVSLIFSPGWK